MRCPVLVVHGDQDAIAHTRAARRSPSTTGGELVLLDGGGHAPHARDPVMFNLLVRDFVERLP